MVVNEKNKQFNLAWEDFSGADYCQTKCEFYNTCRGDREMCPKSAFKKMLSTLTETEEAALKLGFGFCDDKPLPLQEVADYLNLTSEQVRQVTAKAFRKLRHPARSHVILKNKFDYFSSDFDFYKNVITEAYENLDYADSEQED